MRAVVLPGLVFSARVLAPVVSRALLPARPLII
jgi:hypothetical protein